MLNAPITIRLRHNPGFTAWSHGWAYLAPFSEDGDYLRWAVRLPKAGPWHVAIRWSEQTDTIRVGIPECAASTSTSSGVCWTLIEDPQKCGA